MTEQLTHVERTFFASSIRGTKVLRILDAHAARESALVLEVEERRKVDLENCKRIDALVAQLEAARRECQEWNDELDARIAAQLAELTRERDEARVCLERQQAESKRQHDIVRATESEVTRLTEALAAVEREAWLERENHYGVRNHMMAQLEAAKEESRGRGNMLAESAVEYAQMVCRAEAAEARVRELESKYDEAMRLVTALRESSEQARQMSVSARMALAEDQALESRIEALETLLAASEARAAQWQTDAERYRIDAEVAQDRLAALQKRSAAEVSVLGAIDAASDEIVQAWVEMPAGIVGFYHDLGVAEKARRALRG